MRARSPPRIEDEYETGLGSVGLVEELLDSNTEWTNIQDVVRLTFKAMLDTIRR